MPAIAAGARSVTTAVRPPRPPLSRATVAAQTSRPRGPAAATCCTASWQREHLVGHGHQGMVGVDLHYEDRQARTGGDADAAAGALRRIERWQSVNVCADVMAPWGQLSHRDCRDTLGATR